MSTGVSMHASPKEGTDLRRRRLFIFDPGDKVDLLVQALGRPHRFGQVNKPIFTYLQTDLPVETRMAARVSQKLSSLNANVAAEAGGTIEMEVPDLSTVVGDIVVYNWAQENTGFMSQMGLPVPEKAPTLEAVATAGDLFDKVSGRLVLLPKAEQGKIITEWGLRFVELLTQMDSRVMNPLKAKL